MFQALKTWYENREAQNLLTQALRERPDLSQKVVLFDVFIGENWIRQEAVAGNAVSKNYRIVDANAVRKMIEAPA